MVNRHIIPGDDRFKDKGKKTPVLAEPYRSGFADNELGMFHLDNPDIGLFNLVDGELLKLAGSEIFIFKYERTEEVEDIYQEDRDKVINPLPVKVYGHYEPRAVEEVLTEFGLEAENDQMFTFNKSDLEMTLKRRLLPGDIVKPVFQDLFFEVFEVQESSFEVYGVYHLVATAKVLRDVDDRIPNLGVL